jgi:hypothetical protein
MAEKYDLNRMLKEIREDERLNSPGKKKVSQDEIKGLVARKRRERKGPP